MLSEPTVEPLQKHSDYQSEAAFEEFYKDGVEILGDYLDSQKAPTPERRITKVKARRIDDAEEITINYEVAHDKAKDGWFSSTFTSKEEARNEFYEALDTLLPVLIQTVGLNDQWEEYGQVIGVSVKHSESGIGITVTGKCEIDGAYPCPTSPYVIVKEQTEREVLKLQELALDYLDGARRQQSLF
jgi:hypothetical protein